MNIFRSGLSADENHGILGAVSCTLDRCVSGENDFADRRSRRRRQALRQHVDLLSFFIQARHQKIVKLVRFDAEDCFFLRDQAFVHHLQSDPNSGQAGALPITRLQHVELAVLDGELEVLHVAVVFFQPRSDFAQLVVNVGHDLFEFENGNRRAHAGDNVFTLRVHQELAVKFFRADGRIAREADAGAAGVAEIAEHHCLNVDSGSEHVVNVVDAAIVLGAIVLP